jgi:putative transposase
MLLVYRYRIKSLTGLLSRQARACNFVWNFCNETQQHALKWNKRWPSGFDLNRLTAGSSKELALHSRTINAVCEQYAKSRRQRNRPFLRWRGRRSLGWVPLKGCDLKREGNAFRFAGNTFRVNIAVEVAGAEARPVRSGIGIDLGLKDFAALSTGEKIENPRHLRQLVDKLATAQRARKRRQATNLHASITNARRDFHHKLSTRIVREFDYIAVGNVNAAGLAKTRLAKSVLDAGWSAFRGMLRYKATAHGAWYEEVNESFSTRDCSFCAGKTGPKGIADLGIRSWICSECGISHDRDTNSAQNILFRSGHRTPAEGIPVRWGGEDVNSATLHACAKQPRTV